MGFRTVVALNNDQAHEWEKDPELGRKIFLAASISQFGGDVDRAREMLPYGQAIEQVHADQQSLIVADGYGGKVITGTSRWRNQTEEARNLELLKAFADKMGYRISKKPAKK